MPQPPMAQSSSRKTTSHGPNDNKNTRQTNITNFFSTNTNTNTNANHKNERKASSSSRTSYHRPIVLEDDDSDEDDNTIGDWVPPPARIQSYTIHSKSSSTSKSFHSFQLVISKGSVVGFCHPDDVSAHTTNQRSIIRRHPATGIVNAANEGCLYGGGVDGAITQAGGKALYQDRLALPILRRRSSTAVRCPTGSAKITGAPDRIYGTLRVSRVVHAVGPDYRFFPPPSRTDEADRLLRSAYLQSLERARENKLQVLGFALLSAGVFRDYVSLEHVLRIAIEAICHYAHAGAGAGGGCYDELKEVHLCGYTDEEIQTLLDVAEQIGLQPNHTKHSPR